MTEQHGSDPMSEKEKETADEDIIELTDEFLPESPEEDEEIIELIDELPPEPLEEDEDIIELTDALPPESPDEAPDEEAEVIDLTDEVIEEDEPVFDSVLEDGNDEEILELTEELTNTGEAELDLDLDLGIAEEDEQTGVTEVAVDAGDEDRELAFDLETIGDAEVDEEVIELNNEVAVTGEGELDLDLEGVEDDEELTEKDAELAGALGIQLDPSRDLSIGTTDEDIETELTQDEKGSTDQLPTFDIPQKDLEAAIERVIETKLAAKIDTMLTQGIEKAVTTEINRLKRLLTDTLSE